MSIGQHISDLRNIVKQYGQSLTPWTDSQIMSYFASAAATLQTRSYEKGSRQSWWNTKAFCVKMVDAVNHPCESCYPGCQVLKSVVRIPKPLQLKNRDLIRVATLDDKEIHLIQPFERAAKMSDEFFQNKKMASFVNDHLIVYSKNKPSVVLVSGHWQDITEWAEIQMCNENGQETGDYCYNPLVDEFPLDADLVFPAYQLTLELMKVPISLKQDSTNNSNNQF